MQALGLTRHSDPQPRTPDAAHSANASEPVSEANPLMRQLLSALESGKEAPKWQHA